MINQELLFQKGYANNGSKGAPGCMIWGQPVSIFNGPNLVFSGCCCQ